MKLQVTVQSGRRHNTHSGSNHYNEYKNIDVYQDGSCYKSFAGNEERQERVPLLFFLYVGFFFFCERAVELFFEIFGPLG